MFSCAAVCLPCVCLHFAEVCVFFFVWGGGLGVGSGRASDFIFVMDLIGASRRCLRALLLCFSIRLVSGAFKDWKNLCVSACVLPPPPPPCRPDICLRSSLVHVSQRRPSLSGTFVFKFDGLALA